MSILSMHRVARLVGAGTPRSARAVNPATRHETGLYTDTAHPGSWVVQAQKPVRYEVRFCDHLFDKDRTDLLDLGGSVAGRRRRFIVLDHTVDLLHGERIRAYLDHHDVEYMLKVVGTDETKKSFETAEHLIGAIDDFGISRRHEPIIVIGGGVLMDIVGLVGSIYRRGTPFIRVPTTLIGLVDAGIGAKTGVNFNGHKNRLGTYFPAELTLLDRSFLATVDRRHIANGLAEILKIALIKEGRLFALLEQYGPVLLDEKFQGRTPAGDAAAMEVLRWAIHGMLEELQPNLWEANLERCVDYGHTFSPTVEMHALPALLHGEAVCVDMALTTVLACRRGLLEVSERNRVFDVMHRLELPTWDPLLEPGMLAKALQDTIRHRDGQQRLPLSDGIGNATFVNDVTLPELEAAVQQQHAIGQARPARSPMRTTAGWTW
jgi:3-dehydroquinate synthetase